MKYFAAILLVFTTSCAVLPDVADLEQVIPPAEAYEAGIDVPEFAQ